MSNMITMTTMTMATIKSHLKYDRVNILTEQVEEEPVTNVTLPDYCVYAFFLHSPAKYTNETPQCKTTFLKCMYAFIVQQKKEKRLISPVSQAKHKSPDVRAEDDDYSVDDDQAGKEAQEQKPEPDEDVDLFVDCNRVSLCFV